MIQKLIILLFLIAGISVYSQKVSAPKDIYLRVYDVNGMKIGKGRLLSCSETSLYLNGKKGTVDIPVAYIGRIRTKRSAGNDILTGAVIGATVYAVAGVFIADSESELFELYAIRNAALGGVFGFFTGSVIGGITYLFQNSADFIINGDAEKWKAFNEMFSEPVIAQNTGSID